MKLTFDEKKRLDTRPLAGRLTSGEKQADRCTLQGPADYEGLDLSSLVWSMRGVVDGRDVMAEQVLEGTAAEGRLTLQWDISEDFTAVPGHLLLTLVGRDADGSTVVQITSDGTEVHPGITGRCSPQPGVLDKALLETAINRTASAAAAAAAAASAVSAQADAQSAANKADASAQDRLDALEAALQALSSAAEAAGSAALAQQYANAAASVAEGYKGWFVDGPALLAAFPDADGQVGWFALVGSTDSMWVWDAETAAWSNSKLELDLTVFYTKTEADALFVKNGASESFAGTSANSEKLDSLTLGQLKLALYPVGSLYLSASNVNPGTLFGGTWAAYAAGRALVGVGTVTSNGTQTVTAGQTFGEVNHTLTVSEMPSHSHGFAVATTDPKDSWGPSSFAQTSSANAIYSTNAGGGGAHNNVPPSIGVYVWRRTA